MSEKRPVPVNELLSLEQCLTNYGPDMDPSALADWVEFCALHGWTKPWQTLREVIRESDIPAALVDSFYGDEATIEDQLFDDADERAELEGDPAIAFDEEAQYAATARDLIRVRARYLDELYPFFIDEFDQLQLRDDVSIEDNAYLGFLRISVLKGWLYPTNHRVLLPIANLFEQLIAAAMRNDGMKAAVVGTSCGGGFDDKLQRCAGELGIDCDPRAIKHSPKAKDEGVDVIGGHLLQDHRIGEPLWLIQAACGKNGDLWENKLMHIDPGKWSRYLCSRSLPYAFLAVPYHLTDDVVGDFMHYQDTRSFLDRLRLTHMAGRDIVFDDPELVDLKSQVLQFENDWLQGTL